MTPRALVALNVEDPGPSLALAASITSPDLVDGVWIGAAPARPDATLGVARWWVLDDPVLRDRDARTLGPALAAVARMAQADVVLAGNPYRDPPLLGAAVAHALSAPYLAAVERLAPDAGATPGLLATVRARGQLLQVALPLPCVLTVAPAAVGPCPWPPRAPEVQRRELSSLHLNRSTLARPSDPLGTPAARSPKTASARSAAELVRRWLSR
jgi:electron transfer flavoprotein alpha/beta subunit